MATDNPALVTLVVWITLAGIIQLLISFQAIYILCYKDSSEWIDKTYRNLTILIMIFFTASTISDLLHSLLLDNIFGIEANHINEDITTLIATACYFIGDVMFYAMILLRIAVPFSVNKYILGFLSFIIVIFIGAAILFCILINLFFHDATIQLYLVIVDIILMSIDFVLNVTILIIFAAKMKTTISEVDETLSMQMEKSVNLISNTVTKHCVLFGIAMIMNQAFLVVDLHGNATNSFIYSWYKHFAFSVRALENLVNIIVLWLVLKVNYDKYICLCGSCHRCMGKCCFKSIESDTIVENPYYEYVELEESDIQSTSPVLN